MAEPPPVLYPASPDSEAKVSECAGSQFNVRVGPNYARKGNKVCARLRGALQCQYLSCLLCPQSPSDDSMYHLSSVHMFKAESCTKHLHMARLPPPPAPLGQRVGPDAARVLSLGYTDAAAGAARPCRQPRPAAAAAARRDAGCARAGAGDRDYDCDYCYCDDGD